MLDIESLNQEQCELRTPKMEHVQRYHKVQLLLCFVTMTRRCHLVGRNSSSGIVGEAVAALIQILESERSFQTKLNALLTVVRRLIIN